MSHRVVKRTLGGGAIKFVLQWKFLWWWTDEATFESLDAANIAKRNRDKSTAREEVVG